MLDFHVLKFEIIPIFFHSKQTKDSIVKPETRKLSEENMWETLYDSHTGSDSFFR